MPGERHFVSLLGSLCLLLHWILEQNILSGKRAALTFGERRWVGEVEAGWTRRSKETWWQTQSRQPICHPYHLLPLGPASRRYGQTYAGCFHALPGVFTSVSRSTGIVAVMSLLRSTTQL